MTGQVTMLNISRWTSQGGSYRTGQRFFNATANTRFDTTPYWGLQDFMNVNKIPVNNAANLSMFMVSVSAKLTGTFRRENTEYSVLDLRARYRGLKYLQETLKILPQNLNLLLFDKSLNDFGQSVLFIITRNLK